MKLKLYHIILLATGFLYQKGNAQHTRTWATYYGETGNDGAFSVVTDASGNVYMAGITQSYSGIAFNGFQNAFGGGIVDAYLVKFDSAGNRLWATYYGGNGDEMAFFGGKLGVATDGGGNVFLAGFTSSTNNIASGGFQNSLGGNAVNAYLVKFDSAGNRIWGTYYGGTSADKAYSVSADEAGNVYIAGIASSSGLASGGFQNTSGGLSDALLVKFDANGNRVWATYYGGTGSEEGYSVVTDHNLNVYLAGTTTSATSIASGGAQNSYGGGGTDLFVVKFDSSGARLWATYYGGNGEEMYLFAGDLDLATDYAGNLYLAGLTNSTTNIPFGGFQNTFGGGNSDAFLVKFDPSGVRLWATYYGGTDEDKGYNTTTDAAGNVFLAGRTDSPNAIASGGFQNTMPGPHDAFLAMFDPDGIRLCATYFGAADIDECNGVATDSDGNVYLCGNTTNTSGIAWNGFQNFHGGGTSDAFLVKFNACYNTTGSPELIEFSTLEIVPNPASEKIFLKQLPFSSGLLQDLDILDFQGKKVFTVGIVNSQSGVIDISRLPPGMYLLECVSPEKIFRAKFVKH